MATTQLMPTLLRMIVAPHYLKINSELIIIAQASIRWETTLIKMFKYL